MLLKQLLAAHRINLRAGWHASTRSTKLAASNCPDFITKDQWPPNLPNINPMDCHVWNAMLEVYRKLNKAKTLQTQGSTSGYLEQLATKTDQ